MSTALIKQQHGTLDDIERFCAKVAFGKSCITWTAAKDKRGYGVFRLGGRMVAAHRASYSFFMGYIPEGQSVLHRCDNPPCVNPQHLFIGTQADNMADKSAKGRVLRGSAHQNSKLTEADVKSIRANLRIGIPQSVIAVGMGVSQTTISNIAKGKTWRNA